jgi:hypothetical protein
MKWREMGLLVDDGDVSESDNSAAVESLHGGKAQEGACRFTSEW